MSIDNRFTKPNYSKKGKIEADEIQTSLMDEAYELTPLIQTAFNLNKLYPTETDLRKIGKVIDNVLQTSDEVIVDFDAYPSEIQDYINLYVDTETGFVTFITQDDDENDVSNDIVIPDNAKLDANNIVDNDGNIKLEIDKINENAQKYINLYLDDDNLIYRLDENGNKIYEVISNNVLTDGNVLFDNNKSQLLDFNINVLAEEGIIKTKNDDLLDLSVNVIREENLLKTNDETLLDLDENVTMTDNILKNSTSEIEVNYSKIESVTSEIQFYIDTSNTDVCSIKFSNGIDTTGISFSNDDGPGKLEINIDTSKIKITSSFFIASIVDADPKINVLQFSKDSDEYITQCAISVYDLDGNAVDSILNVIWKT